MPRRVEVGEAIAVAPPTYSDELVRTTCVSIRSADDARSSASHAVDAAVSAHRARFDGRHRLRHLSQVGTYLTDVTQ